jgi:diguanylate cyclase (GGDEF)-like protein
MQDPDDGPRVGRRRLSAIQGEGGGASLVREKASVVPAQRLLDVASALSDGATALHARLRHLEPSERDAILDEVADQVTVILRLWADLVRGVVSSDDSDDVGAHDRPTSRDLERDLERDAEATRGRAAGDHPARLPGPTPVQAERPPPPPRDHLEAARDSDRLTRDDLTGVLNRQAGLAALGREMDRCRRGGERFVLGYLNVDGMRSVNDARGPRAGDELLRKVTAALRATLRSYDVIARLGGDEFLFSLPGADMATAELRFKEFAVILSEEAPGSSASVGFAELHQQETLDDLVAVAETAMLKGRRTRRRGRD